LAVDGTSTVYNQKKVAAQDNVDVDETNTAQDWKSSQDVDRAYSARNWMKIERDEAE
jgi:hypothetical protein